MADDRPKRDHQQKRVEGKTSAFFSVTFGHSGTPKTLQNSDKRLCQGHR